MIGKPSWWNSTSRRKHLSLLAAGSTALGTRAVAQIIEFDDAILYPEDGLKPILAAADFDNDGHNDLVIADQEGLEIYFNNGAGSLIPRVVIPPQTIPAWLLAADMDGDHDVDLLWLDDGSTEVWVWYNDGDGQSGQIVGTALSIPQAKDVAAADVTGDGLVDIVLAVQPQLITTLVNLGDRTFEQRDAYTHDRSLENVRRLACGDMDGDGDNDIVATFQYLHRDNHNYYEVKDSHAVLLINEGRSSFRRTADAQLPLQARHNLAYDVELGDLDGDGDLDVVVGAGQDQYFSHGENEVVLVNNDTGSSLTVVDSHVIPNGNRCTLALSDLNTDGRIEILLARSSDLRGGFIALLNEGSWGFSELDQFRSNEWGEGLTVSDLNGDGQMDVIHCGEQAFATMLNITALPGPVYDHTPLVRGRQAEFVVSGAVPGEQVYYLVALGGADNTRGVSALGGITLDLAEPFTRFGTARVQPNGRAVLRGKIPGNAPLRTVTSQAVIRRGPGGVDSVKTPFRTVRITE